MAVRRGVYHPGWDNRSPREAQSLAASKSETSQKPAVGRAKIGYFTADQNSSAAANFSLYRVDFDRRNADNYYFPACFHASCAIPA